MKAVIYEGPRRIALGDVGEPKPGKGEALVNVKYVGLCGTDAHFYAGEWDAKPGVILGHDASGVIPETGEVVNLDLLNWCGKCDFCLQGLENLCVNGEYRGFNIDGFLVEKKAMPLNQLYVLPEGLDLEVGATLEPAAVGVHTFDLLDVKPGRWLVVIGAGAVGLVMVQLGRLRGCMVVALDVIDRRLELAKSLGADEALSTLTPGFEEDVVRLTKGGAAYVIEAAGSPKAVQLALRLAKPRGRVALVGTNEGHVEVKGEVSCFNVEAWTRKDKLEAIRLIRDGELKLKELITHRFPLVDFDQAFQTLVAKKEGAIKVLLEI